MNEKLLTIGEVAQYLDLSKKAVEELVERGELPGYKIGGSFLRFKREQIELYRRRAEGHLWVDRRNVPRPAGITTPYTFWERLEDLLYYNDFYILSLILLILIVLVVFEF